MTYDQENEEKIYIETWKKWESRIWKVSKQRAVEGAVGCSFDDLFGLARHVMLYTIRSFDPTEAKFSTYFYTNFLNAIKTEYAKAGLVRRHYKVIVTHKKTGRELILGSSFTTKEEANSVASSIRGRRRASVQFVYNDKKKKRIPPDNIVSLFGKPDADTTDSDSNPVAPIELLGEMDQRRRRFAELVKCTSKHVSDRRDRKILVLLYKGYSTREVAASLSTGTDVVRHRVSQLRRKVTAILKELVFW